MANGKKKDYRKDPLAGGKGGRSPSSRDVTALGKTAQAYGAARGAIGGRSVASEAMAYLYRLAKGASGQRKMGGAKPKKKNPAMKWSPKGGKGMKKGGRVRRKR